MIINFTDNFQFMTRLQLKGQTVETVDRMKILGTIITDTLSWDQNCSKIISKVNARMQLLRKIWSFGSTREEMVHLWKLYCLSVLDQSCVVWDSSLTQENIENLEWTQKTFCKLVLEESYKSYENALSTLNLTTLSDRRKALTLRFAKEGLKKGKLHDLFPLNKKSHDMKTRNPEKFNVTHSNT